MVNELTSCPRLHYHVAKSDLIHQKSILSVSDFASQVWNFTVSHMMNTTVNPSTVNVQRGRAHPEGNASTGIGRNIKHTNLRNNSITAEQEVQVLLCPHFLTNKQCQCISHLCLNMHPQTLLSYTATQLNQRRVFKYTWSTLGLLQSAC